jgi:hypothetical protein
MFFFEGTQYEKFVCDIDGRHIDEAIRAIGRGLPEPTENKLADTVTPKLHTAPKRLA